MDESVAAALTAAFPGREAAAVEARASRPGNRTVAVAFADGGRAFLKVAIDGDRERVARDAAATRYAGGHCDVRVPAVLAVDPDGDPPFVATAPLAGVPVADTWGSADADARAATLRTVGAGLAGVHVARFDRPGHVRGGDADALDLDAGRWTDVLAAAVDRRAETLFADRFADVPARVVGLLREHRDRLDDAPAALLHGDPDHDNCFLADDGPGFVDWETALVGDPALELCRAAEQYVERPAVSDSDRLHGALAAGYRERAGSLPDGFHDRRPIYRVVAFLEKPRTFDLWAPEADESVDDLAAWVREELDRRLAAV